MLFDRICHNHGIRHLLTAPHSPTTTGKVERFHKTLRAEFIADHDRRHATLAEAQRALDDWVAHYNHERPHQAVGDRPPAERFALARPPAIVDEEVSDELDADEQTPKPRPAGVSRWVDQRGSITLGRFRYRVGPTFAGEAVEVVVSHGLVEIFHQGVLVATHAERRRPGDTPLRDTTRTAQLRRAAPGMTVMRSVDAGGSISFAGATYRVGRSWRRTTVEVAVVGGAVQISADGKVLRVHQIRHDRTKEYGAYATPRGRPRTPKTA